MQRTSDRPLARTLLAFLVGFLTFAASTGGLFIVFPWAQSALVAGIAVGLIAPRKLDAVLAGALVGLLGITLGPNNEYGWFFASQPWASQSVALAGAVLVCAAAALAAAALKDSRTARTALLAVAFTVLIGNLWFTTLTINTQPMHIYGGAPLSSFNEQLAGNIPTSIRTADGVLFFEVYRGVDQGAEFYSAYTKVLRRTRGGTATVADFRTPTVFWLWSALPDARWIVIAFLALASAAVLAVVPIGLTTVEAPVTLPAAAALASYFLYFPSYPHLFTQEPWASAFGVLTLAALALSLKSPRWHLWTVAAAVLVLLAVLTRETMAFLLVAGAVSAFVVDKSKRKASVIIWTVALAAFGLIYAMHWTVSDPYHMWSAVPRDLPRVGQGGVAFMLAAFSYGTAFLGWKGWLVATLSAAGIAGTLLAGDRRLRAFAVIAAIVPLVAFLVIGNSAHDATTGLPINYWGSAVVPFLYALLPAAFVPLAGRRQPAEAP